VCIASQQQQMELFFSLCHGMTHFKIEQASCGLARNPSRVGHFKFCGVNYPRRSAENKLVT